MSLLDRPLLFPVLLFLFASVFFNASGQRTGGWKPIENVSDPNVVDIGKFAVHEHNSKAKAALVFKKVVKGESQVVAGTNYKLTIAAKDGGETNDYVAVVWVKPWQKFRQLKSFTGPV